MASCVTESHEQDPSQIPALLAQVDRPIDRFIGDGMYDQAPVYAHWKRTSGYYAQSHAENVFARDKKTFGGRLRAKRDAAQEREASLACQLLNRMLEMGRPQSSPVS